MRDRVVTRPLGKIEVEVTDRSAPQLEILGHAHLKTDKGAYRSAELAPETGLARLVAAALAPQGYISGSVDDCCEKLRRDACRSLVNTFQRPIRDEESADSCRGYSLASEGCRSRHGQEGRCRLIRE